MTLHPATYRSLPPGTGATPHQLWDGKSSADDAAEADFVADYGDANRVAGRGELLLELRAASSSAEVGVIVQGYNEAGERIGNESRTLTVGSRTTVSGSYVSDLERFDVASFHSVRVKLDTLASGPVDLYAGTTP
jgi:hypothetical protein